MWELTSVSFTTCKPLIILYVINAGWLTGCIGVVGAVQFTYEQRLEFGLSDYSNKDDTINALRRISYMSGGTSTGSAISYTTQNLFR